MVDTQRALDAVACPVLIIHSREDEVIPFAEGSELYARAREPKRFLELRGGHGDVFLVSGEDYIRGIDDFLKIHLALRPGDAHP